MAKEFIKGNEAIGKAAILAGLDCYFGYPITPQSELPEYLAAEMPKVGKTFLQAESEVAAINMVYGAAGTGIRVMTSSSSPGVSLKLEGISYIAGAELPCVVVNVQRGGPGLGNIAPEQGDYFQATKGGGHGNYRLIVLAPDSGQEMADFTMLAFDLAEKYRNPVMLLADGYLGQMKEAVEFKKPERKTPANDWTIGNKLGKANVITSIDIEPEKLEKHNLNLLAKYNKIKENEVRFEEFMTDDCELFVVAYGITSRVVRSAVELAREKGIKVGMLRPQTLFPFPKDIINKLSEKTKKVLVCELSTGQMVEDVQLSSAPGTDVYFYGRCGGMVPTDIELVEQIEKILEGKGEIFK
ncbi:MAG: 3-methyl-2-oxobutanoate dehydrogenase subunit VorB [Candidatus Muiribacterium halophilum]|uniref:3-methyl-2-oxobutanoate dehydrogenase subunit VorB n=1 Tax=Muiribacterium halophilum TaxID=2053465 RepID=A0A2N5ZC10_MUIH1|nr:MAG: 3-methyl-2-oxobutanoate dehydrogenase subunit VorB [Candidatus Muirbacterium halophilum]